MSNLPGRRKPLSCVTRIGIQVVFQLPYKLVRPEIFATMRRKLSAKWLKRILNLWPPYLGSGIRVLEISENWDYARVKLRKGLINTNYFGTAYGGSLFSMTDPFYVLLLTNRLGRNYIVWDKGASIKYISPGKTHVFCEFKLSQQQIDEIRAHADANDKHEPRFEVDVFDTDGNLVAKVEKTLHVKRKSHASRQSSN